MPRTTTIDLFKEEMKFSAGHFTIFSAQSRENFHGHNFTVHVALTGPVGDDGMLADYGPLKRAVIERCKAWNETFFLPGRSRHLVVTHDERGRVVARFGDEELVFLPRDVTILPIANATLEELGRVFGEELVKAPGEGGTLVERTGLTKLVVKVMSGPGQSASWEWTA